MRIWWIVLLSVLLSSSPAAQSHGGGTAVGEVQRHVDINYYAVEGVTIGDLARGMLQRGPVNNGERYFGQTDWTINAEYVWMQDDTGCRADDVVVRLAVTITLPRWEPPRGAPTELVAAWNRFVQALSGHEHNHRRLADEAAEAIRWELTTLRFASCDYAEQRAQQRVRAIIDDYSERNRAYDRRTDHGASEGAVWPPPRLVGSSGAR